MALPNRAEIKPSRYVLFELIKAIEGGNDSQVKAALIRMEEAEVEYLLQLVRRLEGLIKVRQKKPRYMRKGNKYAY